MQSHTHKTSIGAQLRTARIALNLTEQEAAARLRLNPKYIQMMENENFEENLPATFIRGYIRAYARLLNLNEGEVGAALEKMTLAGPAAPVSSVILLPQRKSLQMDRYLRWASYAIVALLCLLVLIWWVAHPRFNPTEKAESATLPLPEQSVGEPPKSLEETTLKTPLQKPAPVSEETKDFVQSSAAASPLSE